MTNKLNTMGLNLAVSQFCKLAAPMAVKYYDAVLDPAVIIAKCKLAANEEVQKGFNPTAYFAL